MDKDTIVNLIENRFGGEGFFVVEVQITPSNKITVYVDREEGSVTINDCVAISRHVEGIFDSEGWFGENYTLEISSPGLTKPLRSPRQYKKNINKKLTVLKSDGNRVEGILQEADDTGIVLLNLLNNRKTKSQTEPEKIIIRFNEIKEAKLKLDF